MKTVTLTIATLLLAVSTAGAHEQTTSAAAPSTSLATLCHRWGLCAPLFTPPPIAPQPIKCPPNAMCGPLPIVPKPIVCPPNAMCAPLPIARPEMRMSANH